MFLEQERIELFLTGLYEMARGNPHQVVETNLLSKKIGMYEPEVAEVGNYLKHEGLIEYSSFTHINLSHEGRKEGARLMEQSHSRKKRRVLEAIADMNRLATIVPFHSLRERLGMADPELAVICNGLDEEGLIDFPGGDFVRMKDAGYAALEPKTPAPPTNILNIQNNYAPVAQGSNFTQNVTQIRNEFDDSIHKLLKAVEHSGDLSNVQKMTLTHDINVVHQLAQMEKTPEVIETASIKIKFIDTVLSSTADMVSLGTVIIPIIRAFFGL